MTRRAPALCLALVFAATAAPPARAQGEPAASEANRAEARDRFDRGLRLFNGGDNSGALVEFKRAYDLVPNVIVLYNIGLVYAQMGRAVEATDALDRVLATPGALTPDRVARAQRARDEQAARIAEVAIEANVEGARVEVDGIEAAKTPVAAPLRMPSGTHVIGLIAPGFSPQRKEIAIAGGDKQSLTFELVAMQGRLAHLGLTTHLPGADLFVDDQRVGTTPLAASISLAPGAHRIELRRPGYTTARAEIALGDGATGEVTLEPQEDAADLAGAGLLALDVSETQPVVTVDGRPRGVYASAIRLVPGPHHVIVERGDFEPAERDVTIEPARTTALQIRMQPTPDYRARFTGRAHSQRTWGWVSTVAGAVVLAGGGVLVAFDATQRSDGNATRNRLLAQDVRGKTPPDVCDPGQDATTYQTSCADPVNAAGAKVDDANTRDVFGWVGVGVGAAAVTLGVILLVTADDPHKYDGDARSPGRWVPSFWTARGGGGAGLAGSF